MIYQWLKDKYPVKTIIKERKNKDILVVCGSTLEIYYLNKVASVVLESMNGKNTVDDIKQLLLRRFDVEERTLEHDLIDVIRDLQWKRLAKLEG